MSKSEEFRRELLNEAKVDDLLQPFTDSVSKGIDNIHDMWDKNIKKVNRELSKANFKITELWFGSPPSSLKFKYSMGSEDKVKFYGKFYIKDVFDFPREDVDQVASVINSKTSISISKRDLERVDERTWKYEIDNKRRFF